MFATSHSSRLRQGFLSVLLMLSLSIFLACQQDDAERTPQGQGSSPFQIVTTILPEYLYVQEILGGDTANVRLEMLAKDGVDLHSFQPSAADLNKIAQSDLFLYVGGESDAWVEKALAGDAGKHTRAISLLKALGKSVKEEEIVEGMQTEKEDERAEDSEEKEYDEHVWLSLRNSKKLARVISQQMAELDSAHADAYRQNAEAFLQKLSALDDRYQKAVDSAEHKTVLFGDRFPFRYLMDDYGLKYYAAFVGCSAESEASFETIAFLSQKLDSLRLPGIFVIEGSDKKIARTVVETAKRPETRILVMNSMQTSSAGNNPGSYISAMEDNLEALKQALR